MFKGKLHFGVILLMLAANNAIGFAACSTQRKANRSPVSKERPEQNITQSKDEKQVKTLKEGSYSAIKDAFIAVARDQNTYQNLRATIKEIPEVEPDFFQHQALVAVFLGSRRSGGYGIEVEAKDQNIHIRETSPSRDMMTTQAFTSTFKIVAIPVEQQPLAITTDQAWSAAARPYQITTGNFTISGGIAGRVEKYTFNGQLQLMRYGQLATFIFHLKSDGQSKPRNLDELATGVVQTDGSVLIEGMNGAGWLDEPHGALGASGRFMENESKLSLTFKTSASKIPDGFLGEGSIEAVATAPPPQKAKSRMSEDEPM